ncbi:hydantoinase/oxoprolinase family protein [Brevibacterium sp. 50QC2O2]|uniref:hydantoinase/oxoprolinase family protein n=1 Tax=Brevibacterium sp. 50QC2O2 TaxID=2968459 RepID=UPI00211B90BD|nr:hydantoinase/oxoprolinase family protein [Brevibacterium sp. 50QC2O2]
MSLRIGVDTGGTFTDVCVFDDATGSLHVRKVSSTPADPGQAILTGVGELLGRLGRDIGEVDYFAHGTTVGTNALLTGRGVPTGLITTRGFRDLLELGRGRRPDMYDPQADKPEPFVPRESRLEVTERVRHTGAVEIPLDESEVRAAVATLRDQGVKAIAVCLLYSYLVPDHERRIGQIIAEEFPDCYVSLSSDVLPEFREYERLSTVVTNAYVGPVVHDYLVRLRTTLASAGLAATPHVTQSNGGVIPFTTAEDLPVRLVLSGPSTGVVGAAQICLAAGHPDIITFDMGGTSSDISLVQNGEPKLTAGMELDGRPIRSPMLDIHTVGAGGGSLAWIDSGGHLRVGPQSAGADPGPACYGKGLEPSVTDANVVLGALDPEYLLGGQMKIDAGAAAAAVDRVAGPLGLSTAEAALGILRVVTANMARAIRVVSVRRGYDPRDYALVPFGGAGPLHASRLARELGMRTIVVPEVPGAQSAMGLLMTDVRTDFMRTVITPVDPSDPASASRIAAAFAGLESQAEDWFDSQQVPGAGRTLVRRAELRYRGQNFELPVEVPAGRISAELLGELVVAFGAAHERVYGYVDEESPIEAVTFRVQASGAAPKVEVASAGAEAPAGAAEPADAATSAAPVNAAKPAGTSAAEGARTGSRRLYTGGGVYREAGLYDRSRLRPGDVVTGPAIIDQMDTTTVLLPGDTCTVDARRNLVISIGDESDD